MQRNSNRHVLTVVGLSLSICILLGAFHAAFAQQAVSEQRKTATLPAIDKEQAAAERSVSKAAINSAVVLVETSEGRSGTGFIIGDGRWIVTNHHVIKDATSIEVTHAEGANNALRHFASIWTTDPANDLAILRLPTVLPVQPLRLAFYVPEQPSDVFALGYPGAVETLPARERDRIQVSWSKGNITRVLTDTRSRQPIEHTARISQGYSGGPLMNECYHVVGMNTAIAREDRVSGYIVSLATLANQIILFARLSGVPVDIEREPCKPGIGAPLDESVELEKWRSTLMGRFERCIARLTVRPEACAAIFDHFPGKTLSMNGRIEIMTVYAQLTRYQTRAGVALRQYQRCSNQHACIGGQICINALVTTMRGQLSQAHLAALREMRPRDAALCEQCADNAGVYDFDLRYSISNDIQRQMRKGRCTAKTVPITISQSCELHFAVQEGASRTLWNGRFNPATKEALAIMSEMRPGGGDEGAEPLSKIAFGKSLRFVEIDNPPCGPGNLTLLEPYAHAHLYTN